MTWYQSTLQVDHHKSGCYLITHQVAEALSEFPHVTYGLLHLFLQHTSASLIINESADPDVVADLAMASHQLAPESLPFKHISEGRDDMPAHLKTALFGHDLTIPVSNGRLALGTWQGIFLWEHRYVPRHRSIILTLTGS